MKLVIKYKKIKEKYNLRILFMTSENSQFRSRQAEGNRRSGRCDKGIRVNGQDLKCNRALGNDKTMGDF